MASAKASAENAKRLSAAGKLADAEKMLKTVVEDAAAEAALRADCAVLRANCLLVLNRLDDAAAMCNMALVLDRRLVGVRANSTLANVYQCMSEMEPAWVHEEVNARRRACEANGWHDDALRAKLAKSEARQRDFVARAVADMQRGLVMMQTGDEVEEAKGFDLLTSASAVLTRDVADKLQIVNRAKMHHEAACALNKRRAGDLRANLEAALRHLREALHGFPRERDPGNWAVVQNMLGVVISERLAGDKRENIETAIGHYEAALQVLTRMAAPHDWATTQIRLASAFYSRLAGERNENIETAIQLFKAALQVLTRETAPHDWATTQMNLASAFSSRLAGERKENIETAIRHYEAALQVWTREAAPHDWATTQMNLANAYKNRIAGDSENNIETAIQGYELALEVWTRETTPHEWATTQMNLAIAYFDRLARDRNENIRTAIEYYEAALMVWTREAAPHSWAATHMNLAIACSNLQSGKREENVKLAIEHYELALEVWTLETAPHDWAKTQMNLGNTFSQRLATERKENIEAAIRHYQKALQVWTREADAHNHAVASRLLATILLNNGNVPDALSASRSSLAALEDLRSVVHATSNDFDAKGKISARMYETLSVLAQCLLHPDVYSPAELLEMLDYSNARGLADHAYLATNYPSSSGVHKSWFDAKRAVAYLHRELEYAEQQHKHGTDDAELRRLRESVQTANLRENELRAALRTADPTFMPAQPAKYLQFSEMQHALGPATVAAVWFWLSDVAGVLVFSQTLPPRVLLYDEDCRASILVTMNRWVSVRDGHQQNDEEFATALEDLADVMQMQRVHDELLSSFEVAQHTHLLLVQYSFFQLAPMDALPLADGRRFTEMFGGRVAHAPSIALFHLALQRSSPADLQPCSLPFLAVQNPTKDLPGADREVGTLETALKSLEVLRHDDATRAALCAKVKELAPSPFGLYLSCHGHYDSSARWKSGLLMAGGEVLNVSDVLDLPLRNCHLCVLSACDTGLQDWKDSEAVGLSSALLAAGAQRVVSALWRVSDAASVLLMTRLHTTLLTESRKHLPLASALYDAREWVRCLSELDARRELGKLNLELVRSFDLELERQRGLQDVMRGPDCADPPGADAEPAAVVTDPPTHRQADYPSVPAPVFSQRDWTALVEALDVGRLRLVRSQAETAQAICVCRLFKFSFPTEGGRQVAVLRVRYVKDPGSKEAMVERIDMRFATERESQLCLLDRKAVDWSFCVNALRPNDLADLTANMGDNYLDLPPLWPWETDPERRQEVDEHLREQYAAAGTLERFAQAHSLLTFAYNNDRPFASPRYWAAFITLGNALNHM